jgi:hypothetical protein
MLAYPASLEGSSDGLPEEDNVFAFFDQASIPACRRNSDTGSVVS